MSAADAYIYSEALENETIEKPFISKEVQVIFDSNNGVYNNQILFSTGNLTNTGKWVDYQNSYIEVPFTMALKSSADITAGANPFMMGLKDGSIQLIDSIILQYNGTSMVQQSILTNVVQHFKILSSWTTDDLTKWGPATATWPDSTTSVHFANAAASAFGDGVSNNQVTPFNSTPAAKWQSSLMAYNEGFLKRMQTTAYNPTTGNNGLINMSASNCSQVGRNYWTDDGGAAANKIYIWQMMLTLRLKDLSDFFNKIPILKAARIDLTINFNSFGGTVTYVNGVANTDGSLVTASFNQISGHTCPFMVSAASVTGGASGTFSNPNGILGNSGTITIGCGINGVRGVAALPTASTQSTIFNNCRWYVPLYEANPEYELRLDQTNPLKTIFYDDFYTYTSITQQTGSFSSLITSGVKNPKYLIVFPFFSASAATSGNALSNAPYQSFFDSAPGTPSPVVLTNFQVFVGGKTLFPLVEQYSFQQYMDEFSSIFGLNGGVSPIMNSGLITKTMWENAPIYVADISRRLPQDDGSSKSVQLSATISSKFPTGAADATVDLVCFVVYQRSCTFNILNGLIQNAV
jgi:hypothetical protein